MVFYDVFFDVRQDLIYVAYKIYTMVELFYEEMKQHLFDTKKFTPYHWEKMISDWYSKYGYTGYNKLKFFRALQQLCKHDDINLVSRVVMWDGLTCSNVCYYVFSKNFTPPYLDVFPRKIAKVKPLKEKFSENRMSRSVNKNGFI